MKIQQTYEPVVFDDGRLAVQIRRPETGELVGWADGSGKFDKTGSWTVCEKWTPKQAAQFAREISGLREYCSVMIARQGVSCVVTMYF